jgi:hypothetical protein
MVFSRARHARKAGTGRLLRPWLGLLLWPGRATSRVTALKSVPIAFEQLLFDPFHELPWFNAGLNGADTSAQFLFKLLHKSHMRVRVLVFRPLCVAASFAVPPLLTTVRSQGGGALARTTLTGRYNGERATANNRAESKGGPDFWHLRYLGICALRPSPNLPGADRLRLQLP